MSENNKQKTTITGAIEHQSNGEIWIHISTNDGNGCDSTFEGCIEFEQDTLIEEIKRFEFKIQKAHTFTLEHIN